MLETSRVHVFLTLTHAPVWPESGAVRLTGLPHGDLGGLAGGQMARTEVAYSWRRVRRHRAEVWSTFKLFVPTPPEGLLPPAI